MHGLLYSLRQRRQLPRVWHVLGQHRRCRRLHVHGGGLDIGLRHHRRIGRRDLLRLRGRILRRELRHEHRRMCGRAVCELWHVHRRRGQLQLCLRSRILRHELHSRHGRVRLKSVPKWRHLCRGCRILRLLVHSWVCGCDRLPTMFSWIQCNHSPNRLHRMRSGAIPARARQHQLPLLLGRGCHEHLD